MTDSDNPVGGPAAGPADGLVESRFQSLAAPAVPLSAGRLRAGGGRAGRVRAGRVRAGRRSGRRGSSPRAVAAHRFTAAHRTVISHRAVNRPRRGWAMMVGLAASLVFAATAIGAIVIITATPDRRDGIGPAAVSAPQNTAADAEGCLAFDQALRRLDEIVRSDAIPHPEIAGVVASARGRVAAAAERTWGPTQQAMDRVVSRLQIWSDHEGEHAEGEKLDDSAEIEGVRTATAVVVTRCAEAGVAVRRRLVD